MADEAAIAPAADSPAAPADSPAPAPSPAPSSTPAEPPASSHGEPQSKSSLLDAVLKVAPATNERDVLDDAADKPSPPGEPDSTDQADDDSGTDDIADDEVAPADASPLLRKKINKLLKHRRELRQEVETLRAPAEIGGELENFAKQNNLSGDDIAGTLRMAAMLRAGDYESFYKAVAPFVRTAQEYLGIVLPKDLQQRVRAGHMTEAAARDFARQRFDGMRSQYEAQAATETISRTRVQSTQAEVQRAVSSFEMRLSASDPDYKAKAPSVRRAVQALLYERGGKISSVDEALAITKEAYAEVNKHLKTIQPPPRATQPRPNGATQTTSARPAPKTLMEAALQGLETARRAGG
jgi:hypothetical protein